MSKHQIAVTSVLGVLAVAGGLFGAIAPTAFPNSGELIAYGSFGVAVICIGLLIYFFATASKTDDQAGKKIGIRNLGKNNTFVNNTFENLDEGIRDEGEGTRAKGNTFVTSHNQSGGITAHTVNVGRQKFELTKDHIHKIVSEIQQNKPVIIRAVGGSRAQKMGESLFEALRSLDLEVYLNRTGVMAPPPDDPITVRRQEKETIVIFAPDV